MFTGSKYAGIVSTVIYFAGVLLNKLINDNEISRSAKLSASLDVCPLNPVLRIVSIGQQHHALRTIGSDQIQFGDLTRRA